MSQIESLSMELGEYLKRQGLTVTTAESCTGGGIAQAITDIAGSSQWFSHGFITYSNTAKHELLNIDNHLFDTDGAVSQSVVEAMVKGALNSANADIAVAVSGIAGPDGGSLEKPVGTVWIAWGKAEETVGSRCFLFSGDRKSIRNQSVIASLVGLIKTVKNTV